MTQRKTTFENIEQAQDLGKITHPDFPAMMHCLPLPHPLLMGSTGTPDYGLFMLVGSWWADLVAHYLRDHAVVFDLGCGCGKTARFLLGESRVEKYIGIDVIHQSIEWAERFIRPLSKNRFEFIHCDVHSGEYNPNGKIPATAYRFPIEDVSVDLVFAASLFTHLLEADARHYLAECARVSKQNALLIVSIHVDTTDGGNYQGSEARIDVTPDFFLKLAEQAGFVLAEDIGDFCGQRTLILSR